MAELAGNESAVLRGLWDKLEAHKGGNDTLTRLYEGKTTVELLSNVVDPAMAVRAAPACEFGQIVVDAHAEALEFQGYHVSGDEGLAELLTETTRANSLQEESRKSDLDMLIYGTSFLRVGAGDPQAWEPEVLVTAESPQTTTGHWNPRTRRLDSAATFTLDKQKQPATATLDVPGSTIECSRRGGGWEVVSRDDHGMPLIPVVQQIGAPRASRTGGQSLITRPLRYLVRAGLRASLGVDVLGEFYRYPQLALLGMDGDAFDDAQESGDWEKYRGQVTAWRTAAGSMMTAPRAPDGTAPTLEQVQVGSPQQITHVLDHLSRRASGASGVPVYYFGLVSDNPASAEGIEATRYRLTRQVERIQTSLTQSRVTLARTIGMVYAGEPPDVGGVEPMWRPAQQITASVAADWALKLMSQGVLTADSEVLLRHLGFSPWERETLESERKRAEGLDAMGRLVAQASQRALEAGRVAGTPAAVDVDPQAVTGVQ